MAKDSSETKDSDETTSPIPTWWTYAGAQCMARAIMPEDQEDHAVESTALSDGRGSLGQGSLAVYTHKRHMQHQRFFHAARWAPTDGSSATTSSHDRLLVHRSDRTLVVYRWQHDDERERDTHSETYNVVGDADGDRETLTATLTLPCAENVRDFAWVPCGDYAQEPSPISTANHFLVAMGNHPVHLRCATTGKIHASYPAYRMRADGEDQYTRRAAMDGLADASSAMDTSASGEDLVGPHALAVVQQGADVNAFLAGYENTIRIFDMEYTKPTRTIATTPSRRSKDGQHGVISALAVSATSHMFAAGTFQRNTIGLYALNASRSCHTFIGDSASGDGNGNSRLRGTGVTQLRFSADGTYLFAACRRDPWLRCWDVRMTDRELCRFARPGCGDTNQRVGFDLDPSCRFVTSGDASGNVLMYDLSDPRHYQYDMNDTSCDPVSPAVVVRAHDDIISSVTWHPQRACFVTTSGQRRFDYDSDSETESESGSDSASECNEMETRRKALRPPARRANEVAIWQADVCYGPTVDS